MKIQLGIETLFYGIKQRVRDPDAVDETESTSLDEFKELIIEKAWRKTNEIAQSK
jgi:hypothetical protein